jgi:very-short-patch-repair endonuclease
VCRVDLSYPELRIAIEYDGQQHREDLRQWNKDIDREDWLERHGWRVLSVISTGIYRRPDQTVARVYTALEQRGCTGLPRVPSDEWRVHFPVK